MEVVPRTMPLHQIRLPRRPNIPNLRSEQPSTGPGRKLPAPAATSPGDQGEREYPCEHERDEQPTARVRRDPVSDRVAGIGQALQDEVSEIGHVRTVPPRTDTRVADVSAEPSPGEMSGPRYALRMAGRNFGRQDRARARREAKEHLALAQAEVDAASTYEPPEDSEPSPLEYRLDSTNRIHATLYYYERRLVRFFIAWQCLDRAGDWVERYSVCTSHGSLHEHTTGHQRPGDARHIEWLYSQADVQECHDRAYDMVHARYQFANGGPL